MTAEHLLGDLTGSATAAPILNLEGVPQDNGCEDCVIRRTYTKDKFRLLETEQHPNGLLIKYRYKPNTNLPIAKLIYQNEQIASREFHEYDDHGTLIKTIVDDGSSEHVSDLRHTTHRLITTIVPKNDAPCFGMPVVVEQHYYDSITDEHHLLESK